MTLSELQTELARLYNEGHRSDEISPEALYGAFAAMEKIAGAGLLYAIRDAHDRLKKTKKEAEESGK